jgi:hypothetical protein
MTKSTGRGPGSILVVPKFGMARHKQVLKTSWEQSAIRTSLARLA